MRLVFFFFFFFFSSRRRHTRFDCDWSSDVCSSDLARPPLGGEPEAEPEHDWEGKGIRIAGRGVRDRKSTRLNSSHSQISYAVFCLKKKTRGPPARSAGALPARPSDGNRTPNPDKHG